MQARIIDSDVDASGALSATATSSQTILAEVLAGSVALAAGQVGVALAGAGASVINLVSASVKATIDEDSGDEIVSAASIALTAHDLSVLRADAGAASITASAGQFSGSVSIGVALATNQVDNDIEAAIIDAYDHDGDDHREAHVSATGDITLDAREAASLTATASTATMAVAISIGFAIAGGGADAENSITSTTSAHIDNSTIDAGGDVTIQAADVTTAIAHVLSVNIALALIGVAAGGAIAEFDDRLGRLGLYRRRCRHHRRRTGDFGERRPGCLGARRTAPISARSRSAFPRRRRAPTTSRFPRRPAAPSMSTA